MLVRGTGIRDISGIQEVSIRKVLSVLVNSHCAITPCKSYYERLEVDEFWAYAGNKGKQYCLIYTYERQSGEMVSYVWGTRDLKTAKRLREKLVKPGVSFRCICTDDRQSFITAFKEDNHVIGKSHTVGIEWNNCRLRHRIRRTFRKTCCFSKKLFNHLKAFRLAFFYINYGYVSM
jgi:IS1 family transposase